MTIDRNKQAIAFDVKNIPVHGDVILAPMDGISDHPFRLLCRRMGSALSYTEFINVLDVPRKLNDLEQRVFFSDEERPIGFQLYGSQPGEFLEAALLLLPYQPDFFDVNLGCSVRRVAGRGAGAGLLNQPETIAEIFHLLTQEIQLPITAKIRLGWDAESRNYLEIAEILQESGAAALAVHARTRRQSWSVPSDWSAIREIKERLTIPVIGNGDVETPEGIQRMKEETGCDAVMIGRGALGNPWIFSRINKQDLNQSEILEVIQSHWGDCASFYGAEKAAYVFRKHLKAYLDCPHFAHLDYRSILRNPQPVQALLDVLSGNQGL